MRRIYIIFVLLCALAAKSQQHIMIVHFADDSKICYENMKTTSVDFVFDDGTEDGGKGCMRVFQGDGAPYVYDIADIDSITYETCVFESHQGHEYVDLGLPSGIKWAKCNIDAESPEDAGNYYSWGETEPKDEYDEKWYKFYDANKKLLKYNSDEKQGVVDNKRVLEPEDDVAHVKWGNGWRVPSPDDWEELRRNSRRSATTLNGIKVGKVTGPNGNSIYLPLAGYIPYDKIWFYGKSGTFWLNELIPDPRTPDPNFRGGEHCSFAEAFGAAPDVYSSEPRRHIGCMVRAVWDGK